MIQANLTTDLRDSINAPHNVYNVLFFKYGDVLINQLMLLRLGF